MSLTGIVLYERVDVCTSLSRTDVDAAAIVIVSDAVVLHHTRSIPILIQHRQRIGAYTDNIVCTRHLYSVSSACNQYYRHEFHCEICFELTSNHVISHCL